MGFQTRFSKRAGRSGQSIVESTLLLLAVATALAIFISFIRAAVSSRMKLGSDTFGHGLLYDGR